MPASYTQGADHTEADGLVPHRRRRHQLQHRNSYPAKSSRKFPASLIFKIFPFKISLFSAIDENDSLIKALKRIFFRFSIISPAFGLECVVAVRVMGVPTHWVLTRRRRAEHIKSLGLGICGASWLRLS